MTPRFPGIVMVSALSVSLSSGSSAQQSATAKTPTHVIDLVSNRPQAVENDLPETERLYMPFGRTGRGDHDPPLPVPFGLRLLGLDRTSYLIGDAFIYELLLSNNTQKAIRLPISPDQSKFRRNMKGAIAASVFLTFEDPALGRQVLGSTALYGAPSVPESIAVIGPGETLELRATGVWYLQSAFASPPPRPWQRELRLTGVIQLFSYTDAYPLVESENTRDVILAHSLSEGRR